MTTDQQGAEGDREKLVGVVQERYGIAKDQAEREVDEFYHAHAS